VGLKRQQKANQGIIIDRLTFHIETAPMRENTPSAMPPCFDNWCQRFDDCLKTKAQKTGFRHYLGGLLGESERKNLNSTQLN